MSDSVIYVSKQGVDVRTAHPKDLLISTDYDTLKVFRSDELSISLPQQDLTETTATHTATYNHNLGYRPFTLPLVNINIGNPTGTINFGTTPIQYNAPSSYILNDHADKPTPPSPFGFGPSFVFEGITFKITTTQLILEVIRHSFAIDGMGGYQTVRFTASTPTIYFTIFYNDLDFDFNFPII